MSDLRRGLLYTLVVVLILAGLYWLVQQLPWRTEEVDNGFSEEARRNPFLAAELFLQRQNVPVTSARGLSHLKDLPAPQGGTLLIFSNEGVLNGAQTETLWQWVEQGGHLIINANTYNDLSSGENRSPLFNRLGVAVHPVVENAKRNSLLSAVSFLFNQRVGKCLDEKHVMELAFEGEEAPLKVALNSHSVLENLSEAETVATSNNDGIQLMRYYVGAGIVTLLTDMSLWSNRYLVCYDHAYLLWNMVSDGDVLILSHAYVPSLFSLLWQHAALAVSLLLLLLAAWLWQRSRRFGPLLMEDHSKRRSIIEHLHARAMFAWRNKYIDTLVEELRQAIRVRMVMRHSGYKKLTRNEQYESIARLCDMSPEDVAQAMTQTEFPKPQQLTELVQRLQQIRNRL